MENYQDQLTLESKMLQIGQDFARDSSKIEYSKPTNQFIDTLLDTIMLELMDSTARYKPTKDVSRMIMSYIFKYLLNHESNKMMSRNNLLSKVANATVLFRKLDVNTRLRASYSIYKTMVKHEYINEIKDYSKKNMIIRVDLNVDIYNYIIDAVENGILKTYYKLPMIYKPNPYKLNENGKYEGGYYTFPTEIVTKDGYKASQEIIDSCNKIQNIGYKINTDIIDKIRLVKPHNTISYDKFRNELKILPKKSKAYKKCCRLYFQEVNTFKSRLSKYNADVSTLEIAKMFKDCDVIYFPTYLDYRSRVYYIPSFLNPQGSDLAKSLIQYADTEELNEEGKDNLYVNLARLYGNDKLSFEDKLNWGKNEGLKGSHIFTQADEPYQFLALQQFLLSGKTNYNGMIHIDASCSGIQVLSALSKDYKSAIKVNLLPGERQDMYLSVADNLVEKLKESDHEYADIILKYVNINPRKAVKTVVMCVSYSITLFGAMQYCKEYLEDVGCDKDDAFRYGPLLAKLVMESISDNLDYPTRVQNWLKKCVSIANESGIQLEWETPTGFIVKPKFYKAKQVRVKVCGQMRICKYVPDVTNQNNEKCLSTIAANFVHSMDSSHLHKTASRVIDEGINFTGIHDSFATTPNNLNTLNRILREEFIKIYSNDVLNDIKLQFENQVCAELPEPPINGDLDIDFVIESEWFFN